MSWWCLLLLCIKQKKNRKLSAKIIYEIWSSNFDLLFLISETLNFSPLSGKICLNSIPKALTDKFNDNKELFNELKQFIENSSLIDSKGNSFWTFPEFKHSSKANQNSFYSNSKDIVFPDPKYYMIGFWVDKTEEEHSENVYSDWETTHAKTNDTLKQSFNKPSTPLDLRNGSDGSSNNVSAAVHKPVLQQVELNKKYACVNYAFRKRSNIRNSIGVGSTARYTTNGKAHKSSFTQHSKNRSKTKPISTVKNYWMLK